jgi:hypothetical protein
MGKPGGMALMGLTVAVMVLLGAWYLAHLMLAAVH